jgi:hypothetical protein
VDEHAVPILPSRDLGETLAFYERLGFEERGAPWKQYDYLIIGRGTIELHFRHEPGLDPLTTDFSCYVRVADAEALHASWSEIGVPEDAATGSRLTPLSETEYGLREFALVDRDGNLVRVGSPVSDGRGN